MGRVGLVVKISNNISQKARRTLGFRSEWWFDGVSAWYGGLAEHGTGMLALGGFSFLGLPRDDRDDRAMVFWKLAFGKGWLRCSSYLA